MNKTCLKRLGYRKSKQMDCFVFSIRAGLWLWNKNTTRQKMKAPKRNLFILIHDKELQET